jgi:hypothetical protein
MCVSDLNDTLQCTHRLGQFPKRTCVALLDVALLHAPPIVGKLAAGGITLTSLLSLPKFSVTPNSIGGYAILPPLENPHLPHRKWPDRACRRAAGEVCSRN